MVFGSQTWLLALKRCRAQSNSRILASSRGRTASSRSADHPNLNPGNARLSRTGSLVQSMMASGQSVNCHSCWFLRGALSRNPLMKMPCLARSLFMMKNLSPSSACVTCLGSASHRRHSRVAGLLASNALLMVSSFGMRSFFRS